MQQLVCAGATTQNGTSDGSSTLFKTPITRFHIISPRLSTYRSGYLTTSASERNSNPLRTIRLASTMICCVSWTTLSISFESASIRIASWIGAQTWIPRSVAMQQASRSISAPLPWQGKFERLRGLLFTPTWICQPKTVCKLPNNMARSTAACDQSQYFGYVCRWSCNKWRAVTSGFPSRSARDWDCIPYWTAREQILNSSRSFG